jgi:amino acid transporter
MRKTHQIAVLLWFGALAASIAVSAASLLFPDAPRNILWACFLGGTAMALTLVFLAAVIAFRDRELDTQKFPRKLLMGMMVAGIGVIVLIIIFFWPSDAFNSPMAGFSNYSVVRVFDTPDFKRKYLFDYQTPEGAKVSFYISASDIFTLSATDIRGESYPLEIPIASGKIPLTSYVVLFCEIGFTKDSTILRVGVNKAEVQRRTLPFVIDLGSQNWNAGTFCGVPLRITEWGNYNKALTNDDINKLVDNVRQYVKLPLH